MIHLNTLQSLDTSRGSLKLPLSQTWKFHPMRVTEATLVTNMDLLSHEGYWSYPRLKHGHFIQWRLPKLPSSQTWKFIPGGLLKLPLSQTWTFYPMRATDVTLVTNMVEVSPWACTQWECMSCFKTELWWCYIYQRKINCTIHKKPRL